MSFQLILALVAIVAFAGVAAWRLWLVRAGRDPLTGAQRAVVVAAFVLVPPVALQAILSPKGVDLAGALTLYVLLVVVLWALEWVAAILVARFAPIAFRQTLLVALVGRDTPALIPFDPPMPPELQADVEAVNRANAAFPRGSDFMAQALRAGFAGKWQALDDATKVLEARIAEQHRLKLGVSELAADTAVDARGRLDTLQREAAGGRRAEAVT